MNFKYKKEPLKTRGTQMLQKGKQFPLVVPTVLNVATSNTFNAYCEKIITHFMDTLFEPAHHLPIAIFLW